MLGAVDLVGAFLDRDLMRRIEFVVEEAGDSKDPQRIRGGWVGAGFPEEGALAAFGLVLCAAFRFPDDLVLAGRALGDVVAPGVVRSFQQPIQGFGAAAVRIEVDVTHGADPLGRSDPRERRAKGRRQEPPAGG